MDDYLRCLYMNLMENRFTKKYETLRKYRQGIAYRDIAFNNLIRSLTPEQQDLLEQYETQQGVLDCLETEILFEEAVALGKWMAR